MDILNQPGTLLCFFIAALALIFPKDAENVVALFEVHLRCEMMNLKLYIKGRQIHAELSRVMKEAWGMEPPPFKFVRIQDRNK